MKFYSADPARGEVTVFRQETGKDWTNFLWNDGGYQIELTHTGASTAKYVSESSEAIVLNEQKSGVVYFRDEESGTYWNAGGWPTAVPVEEFACRHGQKSTAVSSVKDGIGAEVAYAVAGGAPYEVWRVTLSNRSGRPRRLSVIAGTTFRLDGYAQPAYYNAPTTSVTKYLPGSAAVVCLSYNPYCRFRCRHGFAMASRPADAWEGYLDRFTGINGGLARPRALECGEDLSCSPATVRSRCGFLQNKLSLADGESAELYYFFGFCESEEALAAGRAAMIEGAPRLFADEAPASKLRTRCPDARFELLFNHWAEKQVRYCSIGKKAVRDNAQLALGFLNFDAASAKKTIAECLAHQYGDGHAVLLWYPVNDPKLYSDPPFWLAYAVCEYIKETGEISFLNEEYPWLDGGAASVAEHLRAAANWYAAGENLGPHGLPKIRYADWNDALNIPDEDAESVFMGECVCLMMRELAELFAAAGDAAFAAFARAQYEAMAAKVNACAWNGDYYVRAFSKFGPVGDRGCEGGKFYFNTQSFAVLAGIVPPERLQKLLRSVDERVTDEGVRLCVPPYSRYDEHVGRMSGMLPGVYENGGIYNHAGCFKVMADCSLGRAEEAYRSLSAIIPDGPHNPSERSTVEPYVFVNCYLKHPAVDMVCSWSWQTGTSAWALRCYYEGMLGLRREYGGLRVAPCLPAAWKEVYAEREYRGSRLRLTYRNRGLGKVRLTVDGKAAEGDRIAPFADGAAHEVTIEY